MSTTQEKLNACEKNINDYNVEIKGYISRINGLNTRIDELESAGKDAKVQSSDRTDFIGLLKGAEQRLKDQVAIKVKLMDMIEAERVEHDRLQLAHHQKGFIIIFLFFYIASEGGHVKQISGM